MGQVNLYPGGYGPDGSSGSFSAIPSEYVSSAQTGGTPKYRGKTLEFTTGTDRFWLFKVPAIGDYASGGILLGKIFAASAAPGNAFMVGGIQVPAGSILDDVFQGPNSSGAVALSATANQLTDFSIALSMSGAGITVPMGFFIGRDADHASNTCTVSVFLESLKFEYTEI